MTNKYIQLYNMLVRKIEQRELRPGDLLPSERELILEFHLSRDTVRKSLNLLESEGYINTVKGKGSVVLASQKYSFSMSGLVSFKEMNRKMHVKANTQVVELTLTDSETEIREKLELDKKDRLWKVVRVREIEGKRIILDIDYFNSRFVNIMNTMACQDSIYEYLEQKLGLKIGFAKKEIILEYATERDKSLLDLEEYDMVAVVRSLVYLQDGELFQYTESRHRPDKFRFMDFARRIS